MQRFQILIFVILILSVRSTFAGASNDRVVGSLHFKGGHFQLEVFSRSIDRVSLQLMPSIFSQRDLLAQAFSLINQKVEVIGTLKGKMTLRHGAFEAISITPAVADPIDPSEGDGVWLSPRPVRGH